MTAYSRGINKSCGYSYMFKRNFKRFPESSHGFLLFSRSSLDKPLNDCSTAIRICRKKIIYFNFFTFLL